jgi:hypothetical protein
MAILRFSLRSTLQAVRMGIVAALAMVALTVCAAGAKALPDDRVYELVSPGEKNGIAPYAAVPSSTGAAVDFQARGSFAGATWGSLNLYRAVRTGSDWQMKPLTPTPVTPLGALEEQAPVWISSDLSKTIFTTPESYAPGDQDHGSLSLYQETPGDELEWLSEGTQGGGAPDQVTFDTTTPKADHVVFSTAASLLPAATGLDPKAVPEAEYLYERNTASGQTDLLSLDPGGQPAGYAATTLPEGAPAFSGLKVASIQGFAPGQIITVGSGSTAATAQIISITLENGVFELEVNQEGRALPDAFPAGTPVVHLAEGAIVGDGGHLASGAPPAGEFTPANTESGSTTNAISSDGSKVFFEAPNPSTGEPVGLYMREDNLRTVKIAGASLYATRVAGFVQESRAVIGSARFEGAAADGSLVFFTSEEGLAGATKNRELYEFNTTSHFIGGLPPSSVRAVSGGLGGDQAPSTTLAAPAKQTETITVVSTAGFHVGEAILFGAFELSKGRVNSDEAAVIASVDSATELTLVGHLKGAPGNGIPVGDEVHGVHPASMVAVSNDGSHVFFESNGVLAANENAAGAAAVAAEPNLYVFDTSTGVTTFIGTLASSDVSSEGNPAGLAAQPDISRLAVPSPDGHVLVFASAANLTGQNLWQEYTEIYRYTGVGNTLICVSCTAPGVKPTGNASFGETAGGTYDPPGLTSPMSEDGGRVFFQTPDSLVPEDTNGSAPVSPKFGTPTSTDVYEWEAGKVSLISSGSASTPSVLQGTTPSGDDVMFTTTAQLVPGEGDGGYENVFDARVGGGFPDPAQAAPSCSGTGCRAAFGVAPGAPIGSASTGSASGVLGAKTTAKTNSPACGKGHLRRRVKGKVVCARKARHAARRGAGVHHRSR